MIDLDIKKGIILVTVLLLLFSAYAGLLRMNVDNADYAPWVWHNSGIYIQANGTVTPSSAPIQQEGSVYTLKADIFAGLSIEKNNTTLDGNGFRMFGPTYGTGILLQNVANVSVKNVNVQYFEHGIYLDNSNFCTIGGDTLTGCGIEVAHNSSNNQIIENTVSKEILVDFSKNTIVANNTASSICASWSSNIAISENKVSNSRRTSVELNLGNYTEGIYIDNSANCVLSNNTVKNKNVGIDLWQSLNCTLSGNTLQDNQVGFKLWGTDLQYNLHTIDTSNTVNGNPVYFLVNVTNYKIPTNAGWIAAIDCRNITVHNWVSTPNWDGILFVETNDSNIVDSNISNNFNAIRLQKVANCSITQNSLRDNHYSALYLEATTSSYIADNEIANNNCFFDIWHNSTDNTFYHNDFVGNWTGPMSEESRNKWNYNTEGNYWSTFSGVDLDHNGVSESAYLIDTNSGETDYFPLMTPRNQTLTQQQSQNSSLLLSMPDEYLNYTLSNVNGILWAKIDGVYPIHLSLIPEDAMPMVYPTPPGTTNIHIKLDGAEQEWSNYSEIDPAATHYTDIGNWQMVYCKIKPISTDFLLEIQYEHPVEVINGTYTFLYDLNIVSYLDPSSVISTAHFNVQLPSNESDITIYTTGFKGKWSPIDYNSTEDASGRIVTFNIISQYGKPLLGDIAFILGNQEIPELPTWAFFVLVASVTVGILAFSVKRRMPENRE